MSSAPWFTLTAVGRPLAERATLARAFVAKTVFNLPTTRTLRRLCGWSRPGAVPSEATSLKGPCRLILRANAGDPAGAKGRRPADRAGLNVNADG